MPGSIMIGIQGRDHLVPKSEIRPSNLEFNKEVERGNVHKDIESILWSAMTEMARKFEAKVLNSIKS